MTNGEKLCIDFPNMRYTISEHRVITTIGVAASFDLDWWNAEYKEPTTKNDLGVGYISRQAVLELIADYDLSMGQVVRGIHALPSVTPQESKTGHWIEDAEQRHVEKTYHCSECGYGAWGEYEKTEYCGGCGAKMVEPQESEEV